jgi:carboxyl-terminal processing protease
MTRWNLTWLLGIVGANLIGLSLYAYAPQAGAKNKHENLRLFVDVMEEVEHKYYRPLDDGDRREYIENAINGALQHLDEHSMFINAEEYKAFTKRSKGTFGGVGIRLGEHPDGQLFVESPLPGTPAYEAGVLAGDLILKIDGEPTKGMGSKKAVEKITGDPGEKVTLTVLHEGSTKPVDISMNRAKIIIESVMADQRLDDNLKHWDFMYDKVNKIGYIRITEFTENTVKELTAAVDQLQRDGVKGLILDLRTNPGGLLTAAIGVSELFLPPGTRVVTTKGRNEKESSYDARKPEFSKDGPYTSYPVVILMNKFSASASEIVAGALQEAGRAVIVGERSYGKGSVQTLLPMEGGTSALKLTTATYYVGKNERNINRSAKSKDEDVWGVKPDPGLEVVLTPEERVKYYKWRRIRDIVRKKDQPLKIEDGDKVEASFKDRVLDKAHEYLVAELQKRGQAPQGEPQAAPAIEVGESAAPARRPGISALAFRASPFYLGRDD